MAERPKHPEGALRTENIAEDLAEATGPLHVVVVSPARPVYEGKARSVTVETELGSLGIWPKHTDLVAALGIGPLRIMREQDGRDHFAVWGGFLKVGGGRVTILVDRAARADEIDPEAVRKELEEVRQGLRHPGSDEEFHDLLRRRRWCETRLQIAG